MKAGLSPSENTPPSPAPATASTPSPIPPLLLTIGYGNRTIETLIALLKQYEVAHLVDVRTAPYSKFKPEYSQDVLHLRLRQAGLNYLFLGDTLGGQPKDPACLTGGRVDYDKVRTLPFFKRGLEKLGALLREGRRVALMCSEGRPEQCHRSKLIGEALAEAGVTLSHIDEGGGLLSQRQVIDRLTQGQLDLFGQSSFTSRKRYGPRVGEGED